MTDKAPTETTPNALDFLFEDVKGGGGGGGFISSAAIQMKTHTHTHTHSIIIYTLEAGSRGHSTKV